MRKNILFLVLFLISTLTYSQIPVELSIKATGSNVMGIIGGELQIYNFSISETWRPLIKNVNSYITTGTYYFKENDYFKSQPYASLGFATKGYPYADHFYMIGYDLEPVEIKFAPAIVVMGGLKTIIANRFTGKGGIGITLSEHGQCFSFEVGFSYTLFTNKRPPINLWVLK